MHYKETIDTIVHTLYKSKKRSKKLLKVKNLKKYIQTFPVHLSQVLIFGQNVIVSVLSLGAGNCQHAKNMYFKHDQERQR